MIHLEHDYQGSDYSINLKALNPSPIDFGGMYFASYLQSVTKNLAVGFESLHQRASGMTDTSTSYLAKYTGSSKDWIATAQLQPSGALQATYWQKLGEKVEAAADLHLVNAPQRRDAVATLGLKYDLRMSTFRAQLDSTGKVSALLEQRFAPTFAFLVSGEIDHFKVAIHDSGIQRWLTGLTECRTSWYGCDDRERLYVTGGDGKPTSPPASGVKDLLSTFATHFESIMLHLRHALMDQRLSRTRHHPRSLHNVRVANSLLYALPETPLSSHVTPIMTLDRKGGQALSSLSSFSNGCHSRSQRPCVRKGRWSTRHIRGYFLRQ